MAAALIASLAAIPMCTLAALAHEQPGHTETTVSIGNGDLGRSSVQPVRRRSTGPAYGGTRSRYAAIEADHPRVLVAFAHHSVLGGVVFRTAWARRRRAGRPAPRRNSGHRQYLSPPTRPVSSLIQRRQHGRGQPGPLGAWSAATSQLRRPLRSAGLGTEANRADGQDVRVRLLAEAA